MKIVTYQCDLCKEKKDKAELKAYYWKSDIMPQGYVLQDISHNGQECDKHICTECIKNIVQYEREKQSKII